MPHLRPQRPLMFINQKDLDNIIEIYATPNWVECGELPLEVYYNEELIEKRIISFSRLTVKTYLKHVEKKINKYSKKYLT